MPTDYDLDAESQQEQEELPEASSAPEPFLTPRRAPEPLDELEVKMTKAQYYWDLMRAEFFNDPDEIAMEVEDEVRSFIKSRLAELMGGKPRGRKKTTPKPTVAVRRSEPKRATVVGSNPKIQPRTIQPSQETNEEVVQEVVSPDGFKKVKIFRKMVDPDSGRVYYMGYDKLGDRVVGDGNRYELAVNANGGQFFRVFSQQFIPPTLNRVEPLTPAEISAASERHAAQTIEAIRTSNSVLAAAVALAQKQ